MPDPSRGLEGRNAVVLGATGGIGGLVVSRLLRAGANVALAGRDRAALERAAAAADASTGRLQFCDGLDLTDPDAIASAAERLRVLGPLHAFVQAASAEVPAGGLRTTPFDTLERAFAVKLIGPLALLRELRNVLAPDAAAVFLSGSASRYPTASTLVQATVNAAVAAAVRALAQELAPVRVLAISPGHTRTPRWERMVEQLAESSGRCASAVEESIRASIVIGRPLDPEEIAWLVVETLSPGASFLTGTEIDADGGRALGPVGGWSEVTD